MVRVEVKLCEEEWEERVGLDECRGEMREVGRPGAIVRKCPLSFLPSRGDTL